MKYSTDDISIGDEVIFRSTNPYQPDYDLPWIVHGKEGDDLLIHIFRGNEKVYWTINIREVLLSTPQSSK